MKDKELISRRACLKRSLGLAGLVISLDLLEGCGSNTGSSSSTTASSATAPPPGATPATQATAANPTAKSAAASANSANCMDVSGLTDAQVAMRKTQHYVDASPYPDKKCDGCVFFIDPKKGEHCGSCQVLKGPINPQGHCNLWQAKPA